MSIDGSGGRHRARLDPLAQLAGALLGLAGGLAVNKASDDLAYSVVAAIAIVGAALSVLRWLRRLPPRAPLARFTPPVLLTLALAVAVLSVLAPRPQAGPSS